MDTPNLEAQERDPAGDPGSAGGHAAAAPKETP